MTTAIRRRSLAPAFAVVGDGPDRHPIDGVGASFSSMLHGAVQELDHIDHDPTRRVQPVPAVRPTPVYGPLIVGDIVLPAPLPR